MNSNRLAQATIFCIFCLLLLGALVHNTQSSLACPDWPLCYGQFFPKMEGGILIEHGHRLLASFVGLLTIALLFVTSRKRKEEPLLYHASWVAFFMVLAQGLLGGITVIYKLPTIVSTSHLALSLIFFCTIVFIQHQHNKLKSLDEEHLSWSKNNYKPAMRMNILIALGVVYAQILLGAFMRHAGAGASCGVGAQNAFTCLDINTWKSSLWPSMQPAQLHMLHRYFALVATAFIIFSFAPLFKKAKDWSKQFPSVLNLAVLILFVIVGQITIGVLTVAYGLSVIPTTAHLGGAALLLALTWKLNLKLKDIETLTFPDGAYTFLGDLLGLTKPKLSALVMVTILVGMLVSAPHLHFFESLWAFVLMAMVVMGAATLNCFIEKDIDAKMHRTKDRSLPAGRLNPSMALFFGLALLVVSFPLLVVTVNWTTALLALLAAALYLFVYTPLKQKTELAVYVGAIPGAIPPIMGRTAVTGGVDFLGVALFLILLIWQLPHFLAISIFHSKDYDAAGLKIYPTSKGVWATKIYMAIFTTLLIVVAALPYYFGHATSAYNWAAIALGIPFLGLSYWGVRDFKDDSNQRKWAKTYFWGSIIYLPALLCAMLFLNS